MTDDALARRLDAIPAILSGAPVHADDATATLWCAVHGEPTLHVYLAGRRWECAEALSTGYCGETRDGRSEGEGMYGEAVDDSLRCDSCGAVVHRPTGLPFESCELCGAPLPIGGGDDLA